MTTRDWLEIALVLQCILGVAALALMKRRNALNVFPYLGWTVLSDLVCSSIAVVVMYFRHVIHLDARHGYFIWFVSGWLLSIVQIVLRILVVYGVFTEAMRPLAGLHQAGKIIFRWVGLVSLLVSLALLAGPGAFSGFEAFLTILSRFQQGVSVLTLCLLVFVCFAIRPLGLTFRSHLFGVSLGLGLAATVELVQAAWVLTAGAQTMYSPVFLFSSIGFCVALSVWGTYFALPDPPRKMILLPTTSPFFLWNRISEILGDAPGQVAVAGFTPDMLAPAELEMFLVSTAGSENLPQPAVLMPEAQGAVQAGAVSTASPLTMNTLPAPTELPTLTELSVTASPSLAL